MNIRCNNDFVYSSWAFEKSPVERTLKKLQGFGQKIDYFHKLKVSFRDIFKLAVHCTSAVEDNYNYSEKKYFKNHSFTQLILFTYFMHFECCFDFTALDQL